MGKNKHTELDKLFQSKLGEEGLESGAWNEPTDDSFFAAMEKVNVPAPKKKRRVLWPYFSIALVVLLGFTILNSLRVDDLKSTISEMQKEEAKVDLSAPQTVGGLETSSIIGSSDIKEVSRSTESVVQKDQSGNNTPVKSRQLKNTNTSKSKAFNRASSSIGSSVSSMVPPTRGADLVKTTNAGSSNAKSFAFSGLSQDATTEALSLAKPSIQKELALSLGLIPSLSGFIDFDNRQRIDLGLGASEYAGDEGLAKKRAFEIYAFMDVNLNSLRMSGLESSDYVLSNYDKSYLGYDLGIGATQAINDRFGIGYNLAYRHVMNKSLFTNEMEFDKSQMSSGVNGEQVYNLITDLQTPTGSFYSTQSLSVMDDQITDHDMMQQSTDIKQLFDFISFGIRPRVNLGTFNNLKVFAEAGLNVNYLISFCQEIDMKMYYGDEMMMRKPMEDHSMNTLNRFSLAASTGLGVEYKLGDHIFSSFKLGSSRSLNSIRQKDNGTNQVGTFIDNLGVSLSAGYKF